MGWFRDWKEYKEGYEIGRRNAAWSRGYMDAQNQAKKGNGCGCAILLFIVFVIIAVLSQN